MLHFYISSSKMCDKHCFTDRAFRLLCNFLELPTLDHESKNSSSKDVGVTTVLLIGAK